MSCSSKDIFKNAPCIMYNTRHEVTDLLNHAMVKNIKNWISWERNITFLRNKKDLCLRWHILRNYRFCSGGNLIKCVHKLGFFLFVLWVFYCGFKFKITPHVQFTMQLLDIENQLTKELLFRKLIYPWYFSIFCYIYFKRFLDF